jgi:dTDP-4-amino-4,6-dideoxygalactose transaminase
MQHGQTSIAVDLRVDGVASSDNPVYLAGLPVDMTRLYTLAKKHNLRIVEDAAQARATFMAQMQALGGGIGYHYPPIHLLSFYRERGFKEGMFTAMSKAVLRS